VLCSGVPRFEPGGVFAGYIGSDTDITEQKRAAKELQSKFGQVQVLFELAGAVSRAQKPSEIYRAAVQGLVRAVGADRASVLIFDPHDVMRFEAWIGLSDEYRVAVEGHTPWRRGVRDAQPIAVADVMQDPSLSAYWQVFAQEGIRAVAFIPVLGNGGLIGKFMLYYNAPHEFQAEELQVAQTIATDVAFAAERQHAETALRDSEERFRATFFQAAVGIAQTNPDAKWLLLNDRFCEMLGYTPAELRGKTFLDFTHPDDREASLSAVRRLLADEISSWLTEKRYIRKDGAIVWVRLWVSLVRDQDKRPQYFISVVEDVTDRIEAERALRDSERRLALAQSGAHLGIWERDLRTNVKTISGEYAKLYGLPLDKRSLTYEEWLSLIHPDDGDRLQTQIGESIERTGFWDTEFRVVWPDGSVHWLLTKGTVLLDDSGQPVRRAGVNLDITERKLVQDRLQASERRLSESEERLKSAQRLAHVGNWTWDIKADRVFWSEELCRIFGTPPNYTPDYAGFLQAVQPQDRERVDQAVRDSLAGNKSPDLLEFQITRPSGELRTVVCISEVLRDGAGAPVSMSGACQDVTDQRRAEAASRQSLDEIAHLNRVAACTSQGSFLEPSTPF
jgi:PAS domain S-box-containing protein